jgi:hypothetical protein
LNYTPKLQCSLLLLFCSGHLLQSIQAFTSSLQAAYTAQLLPMGINSVNVTQLICNGDSYELIRTAQWDGWPGAAVGRRLQQLSVITVATSSSSSSGLLGAAGNSFGSLDLSVELEIHRHDYVSDVSSAADWGDWMDQTRREAAAASAVILPKLLGDLFKVTVVSDSLLVTQLPTVLVTSRPAPSGVTGQLEVTRTTSDPLTGAVLDTQLMVVMATGDENDSSSSSSSSSNATKAGVTTQDTDSDTGADDTDKTDVPGSSSSSSSTSGTSQAKDDSSNPADADNAVCGSCSLRNAVTSCVHGRCAISRCLPGWQDCDGLAATGCEADVLSFFSNSAHCGGCHKICLAPLTCSNGKCGLPKPAAGAWK